MSDALRIELILFGIDVVMIEPGTVNTAMYDKGEKEDLSEFKSTEYWNAGTPVNFQKWIVNERRTNGLPPRNVWAKLSMWCTQHCETEGTLCYHSATIQKLDIAQTPSCEDVRHLYRKANGTQKEVARFEWRV